MEVLVVEEVVLEVFFLVVVVLFDQYELLDDEARIALAPVPHHLVDVLFTSLDHAQVHLLDELLHIERNVLRAARNFFQLGICAQER